MLEAILYVEFADDFSPSEDRLKISLMNCKQLVYRIPGALIVHIACNDPESLNRAITRDFAGVQGVGRITTCIVKNH